VLAFLAPGKWGSAAQLLRGSRRLPLDLCIFVRCILGLNVEVANIRKKRWSEKEERGKKEEGNKKNVRVHRGTAFHKRESSQRGRGGRQIGSAKKYKSQKKN